MKVNQKDWSCPKKQIARLMTIIKKYQSNFSNNLPQEKQYWTMAGQCANHNGEPKEGSEIQQMLSVGLIQPHQFRGVEINYDIHQLNKKAFPHLNWINKDFYSAMSTAYANNEFNPAIVNADLTSTPETGCSYISRILALLSSCQSQNILLIANLIIRMKHYKEKNGDYIVDKLNEYPQFTHVMSHDNWNMQESYYRYDGTGDIGGRTYMGTLVFTKKAQTICN